ncbi:MAG: class I adenylate-forming enzyme family protein [Candidatus Saccharibacteria bacterium]|uniref:Long-chain-fatty-acid--CoA ligase n=1 Tax=Candidatus Nanosyncoccus alces TaxID=2171997 RepID=A0ABY0FN15_9BACT|nr:class I adenylate-forming enzyme family protein [Candidatus Nanosyncoccus alces]MDO4399052.1 class I adenylate-forming enzyme family protein [Candidatus Saccharibacteria bacterium]RYC74588.1 Long-chain-fatty-acid--CoA ligase [Candidatus Nanosyncoccus alces]
MKKSDKKSKERPWLEFYDEDGIPSHIEYPDCSMVDMVLQSAEKWPDNIAYTYYGHKVTYKNFVKKIEKTARALKNYGVKEGDRVTICMPNTPEGITMVYAVNMVGAVCNMVHPLSSEKELEYYIKVAESKYVLVIDAVFDKIYRLRDTAQLERIIVVRPSAGLGFLKKKLYNTLHIKKVRLPANDNRVVLWEDFIANSYFYQGNYHEERGGADPAVIMYSGGTTGAPKAVLLSNLNINAESICDGTMIRQIVPGATVLSILPLFHCFGLGVCIHTPLCKGMGCILIPAFSHKQFADIIKKNEPNFIVGVPTLFEALVNTKLKSDDLKSVTAVICGGDALTQTLRDRVNEFLKSHGSDAKIRVGYGLTEGSGAVCLSPENTFADGIIGVPLPDTDFKIIKNDTFKELPAGEEGEICISGPLVMMGYLGDDAETAQTIRLHDDGKVWLHTGDIGYLGKDGLIYFAQRLKRIIISSGYNIYPTHLESIINSHEAVLTSTVIGIDHHYKGQVPKAFIVLKPGYKAGKKIEREIRELLERNVPIYALPVAYEFRDKLPQTLVGKVAFKKLEAEEKSKK